MDAFCLDTKLNLSPTIDEVVNYSDTLVVGNRDEEFAALLDNIGDNQVLLDLVRLSERVSMGSY